MNAARRERRRRAAPAPWFLSLALAASSACGGTARPAVTPAPASRAVDQLQRDLDRLLGDPVLGHASWGVAIRSVADGRVVYQSAAAKLLLPASTMKLVTLAAAAERLGWSRTFETQLLGVGAIDFGFLDGDLVVIGTGDPSIDDWDGAGAALFRAWADRLKALGVRTIGGRVIGDDDTFDDQGLGDGWAWDDLGASFATAAGALQFNQNTVRIAVTPAAVAAEPPTLALIPAYSPIVVRSTVTTVPGSVPAALSVHRLPGSNAVELTGAVPAGGPTVFRNVSVDNPTQYFVTALREALIENGIEVRGEAVDVDDIVDRPARADGVPLVTHQSPPLSVLAQTMMKNSQNMYAETLLRAIGTASHREEPAVTVAPVLTTAERGRLAVGEMLETWRIGADEMIVADGSGLSRYNLATADAMTRVLVRMAADEEGFAPYLASLPIAGRDGTLAGRLVGTAAEGNVRAKTGSFSNARTLAGYATTADGELLAFAVLANNFATEAAAVDRTIDSVVTRLASFSSRAE